MTNKSNGILEKFNEIMTNSTEGRSIRRALITLFFGSLIFLVDGLTTNTNDLMSFTGIFLLSGLMGVQKYVKEKWMTE